MSDDWPRDLLETLSIEIHLQMGLQTTTIASSKDNLETLL
jgi:hypothetical protein